MTSYWILIRENRAGQLAKGLLIVILAAGLSNLLNLYALSWLIRSTLAVGVIALVVIFQPELRRALESLGRSKFFKGSLSKEDKSKAQEITREFVEALLSMSDTKTGALIVIERQTALTDICETGTEIDSKVTAQLIGNIFYEGAPLHDGAVIVRGDRLHSAGCVLPLTSNQNLPKELGTRHRAGIGITEVSDAICSDCFRGNRNNIHGKGRQAYQIHGRQGCRKGAAGLLFRKRYRRHNQQGQIGL